ncbi:forkhead box protein I2-like isoform X2 [Sceloporus undulatus]|uniref:forkhead box protein I2-like isoform X2 n=1 Tax=Sceloporus undulatus TaxID=8520 RepID=UPI001C4D9827|nr:forkhead box protein I2-like isoform X2 [Sceloporus undulatus]
MEQDPNAEATAAVEQQGSSEAQGSEGTTKPLTKAIRPPFTYTALIALALRESPEGRLPLRAIYRAITRRFPYYRLEEKGWQNCVRHNLSLNECFLKVPMPRGEGKRGNLWSINPAFQSAFERGNYRGWRRRARVPQVPPPPPPFPYYFHYQPPSPPPPTRR